MVNFYHPPSNIKRSTLNLNKAIIENFVSTQPDLWIFLKFALMKVELVRVDKGMHFNAVGASGNSISLDASPEIGGSNAGVRPMETLLMALGGCSGIDILHILRHHKDKIEDIRMVIEAEREKDKEPALFETIAVKFMIKGDLDPHKVERAVKLSMDKYCSVAKTLEKSASIDYSVELNGVIL